MKCIKIKKNSIIKEKFLNLIRKLVDNLLLKFYNMGKVKSNYQAKLKN